MIARPLRAAALGLARLFAVFDAGERTQDRADGPLNCYYSRENHWRA